MYSYKTYKNLKNNFNSAIPKTFLGTLIRKIILGKIFYLFWFIFEILNKLLSKIIFRKFCYKLYADCKVIGGPFKGLKYSEPTSACGPLIPKLLGTYESELIPTINSFKGKEYSKIIDIGAAEGYYALGFSIIFPDTKILAYEIHSKTIKLLNKNIKYNNKELQIKTSEDLCYDDFSNIKPESRLLILSDCEGYEHELFKKNIVEKLANSDLIIEMHTDNLEKSNLEESFEKSHYIEKIGLDKHLINIDQYSNLDIDLNNFISKYAENRLDTHHYLILRSKNHN